MRRLGVLGWPVAHSRSPAIHNAALQALGLHDWRYQRLPVPPWLFAETASALGGASFVGANVTIPHKRAALALCDTATEAARSIGAANTLTFAADGSIAGENTDAPGLIAALRAAAGDQAPAGMAALVLGAGGSARAAVWALREAGASEVSVWNRTSSRARELARDLDVRFLERPEPADLLVNCTSVGMAAPPGPGTGGGSEGGTEDGSDGDVARAREHGDVLAQLSLSPEMVGRHGTVVDLVYREDGRPTELLAAAGAQGACTVDGLEVLVAQGAISFELWTGLGAPLDVMAAAARARA